ncbi:hypothetical protein, partial [Acetobacter okinawensis]|uniref:hypothetical protein n=1 Tax=Acetobacter okinawensis TaxID=1076594 RepID=UPI001BA75FF9
TSGPELPSRRRSCSSCVSAFCAKDAVVERRDKARDTKMVLENVLLVLLGQDCIWRAAKQNLDIRSVLFANNYQKHQYGKAC